MSGNTPHYGAGEGGQSRLSMRVANLIDSNSFKEAGAFGAAEIISMGVSLGVVGVADQIAPHMLDKATKVISKTIIEPYLDKIEGTLGGVCKLDSCRVDESKSREERAERLAHTTVVFSAAWVISMAAKLASRRFMTNHIPSNNVSSEHYRHHPDNKKIFGTSKHELKLFAADEGVHYGSLLLMNTGAAKITDELINTSSNILVKCGVPKKKAHELSSMAMIWEVPNLLGMFAGLGVISKYNNHNWGQHKL